MLMRFDGVNISSFARNCEIGSDETGVFMEWLNGRIGYSVAYAKIEEAAMRSTDCAGARSVGTRSRSYPTLFSVSLTLGRGASDEICSIAILLKPGGFAIIQKMATSPVKVVPVCATNDR